MIDCTCGKTVLNTQLWEAHVITAVVVYGESRDRHKVDHDGPTVIWQ